jgi:hypothetical protein
MAAPKVKIARTNDDVVNRNLDSVKATLDNLTSQPQPISLVQILLQQGLNLVQHGLNKPLTGWFTSRISIAGPDESFGGPSFWDNQGDPTIATLPNIYLYLNVSRECIVNLEVW